MAQGTRAPEDPQLHVVSLCSSVESQHVISRHHWPSCMHACHASTALLQVQLGYYACRH